MLCRAFVSGSRVLRIYHRLRSLAPYFDLIFKVFVFGDDFILCNFQYIMYVQADLKYYFSLVCRSKVIQGLCLLLDMFDKN